MKIGIDCRMYGLKHTGIGRYVMNLVKELLKQDKENEYVLFTRNETEKEMKNLKFDLENSFKIKNLKLKIVLANIEHYSLKEQVLLSRIINRENIDLMHFPHFNVPVFYRGKYVVTIHDLIKHTSKGSSTTTRSPLIYWFKYLGYKFVFWQAVKRSSKILCPSNFVKKELVRQYSLKPEKIAVIYEGVDESIKSRVLSIKQSNNEILNKHNIRKPYLLYVGNVYPHKNIEKLLEAIKILNQLPLAIRQSPVTLVVVCARNVFSERLRNEIVQKRVQNFVNLVGFIPDDELSILYQEAEAFVFPTLSEGFGLPGLEAMAAGCPVICSDIPVLKEIYQDSAVYFDPLNSFDMVDKIKNFLLDKNLKIKFSRLGLKLVKKYSWNKLARETLAVYQSL